MSSNVYSLLRKSTVQEEFITGDRGHDVLAKWLEVMPDGTFPSYNLVKGLLECINSLQIDESHLENSELIDAVNYYAEGIAKVP